MKVRRAGRAVTNLIAWILIAFAFATVAFLGIGPRIAGYRTLTVLTGSMRPAMPPGSVLVATREPIGDLRVGQVLVYQIPVLDHRVVSHRVVDITRTASGVVVQTKGDANNGPDPWRARITDATVWHATVAVPYLGAGIRALRSPAMHRMVLFALPALLAIVWLADIWFGPKSMPLSQGHA
jgi:signal peptidase